MRYVLLVLLCALNLSASAQWWRGDFKKHPRFALITRPKNHSIQRINTKPVIVAKLPAMQRPRSVFNLHVCENIVMKEAQHHMRFREYPDASYKFSELAALYVQENRLSEAKWYYLQSLLISKRVEDVPHTISNLIALAMIKADLGDISQAQDDLNEARGVAVTSGRAEDIRKIDDKIKFVQTNTVWLAKEDLRYADNATLSPQRKKTKTK